MKRRRTAFNILALVLAGAISAQLALADPLPNAWQITDSSTAGNTLIYYTNQPTISQQNAATNSTGGFHMTVVARLVDDLGGPQTMVMAYGLGNKRFLIWWELDGNGNLTADLDQAGTYTLTTNGAGSALYHTHEIIYNPTNGTARYVFDGQVISNNWSASSFTLPAGEVRWGASAQTGKGRMNFNRVTFAITNQIVVSYDAGTAGNPVVAPDPTNSVPPWRLFKGAGAGTSFTNISPDLSLLPVAMTLAPDQFLPDSARLNGQVNASGSPAIAWFEWGTDTNYGNATLPQSVGFGISVTNVAMVVSGLVGGTDYHFRTVVSNAFGTVVGIDRSFILSFLLTTIPGLPGVYRSSVAWGDYDNDGRLDFLLTGNNGSAVSQVWRNTGNGFSNVTASVAPGLPGVYVSSVAWGDYDNDGRLDFLLTGYNGSAVSQVWRNTGNGFSNMTASVAPGLPGVASSSVAWGDYDNDGRLDILLTGYNGSTGVSQVWRNTGNGFSNVTASVAPGLPGVYDGSVARGDYDNDGRLDFLLTGNNGSTGVSQVWRSTGNGFSNVTASVTPGLPGVLYSSVAWGDYDNDGRLGFLLTGYNGSTGVSQVWRNTGNGFSNVTASVAPGLPGVYDGSVAWGDYDNDGRLDFLLTGDNGSTRVSQLWRSTGNGFSNVAASVAPGLPGVYDGSVAWGDNDNDGRLDFLLTGDAGSTNVSQLWRNNLPHSNAPPAAPADLSATVSGHTVEFNWAASTDALTPSAGLNYNVRIGTTPNGSDVLAPMARTNGLRLLPGLGNAQTGTNGFFRLEPGRTYYWSLQALDTSFAGSPFAPEQQFTFPPLLIDPIRYPGGQFEFYFINQTALNFEVLVSTNVALPLAGWLNLGPAIPLGGGYYRFTDAGAIGHRSATTCCGNSKFVAAFNNG